MSPLLSVVQAQQLRQWLQELVRRPSPQTERMEEEPAVQAFIAEGVRPLLAGLGIASRLDPMGNLIAEIGPRDGPSAMILAYAMTHPASSMTQPFSGELVHASGEEWVRGRGAAEQKGALAAAIAATFAAAKANPRKRIVFALSTAGETGQHKAAQAILSALDRVPDVAIVAIGSGGRISLANKGRVDVHIEIKGKASHSSTPWLGVDAIAGARAVLERLAALDLGAEVHPQLGKPTLTPTAIHSFPEATHTIQNLVRMTYDRRLLPGQDPEPAVRAIAAALEELVPWRVRVRAGALQYPAEVPADGLFMRCARRGATRMGLAAPETFVSHGCVDTGLLVQRGCEAAMWGPGDPTMWHTDEERLPVRALLECAAGYLGFLLSFQEEDGQQ